MNIFQQIIFYITSFWLAVIPTTKYVEGVVGQPASFLPSQAVSQTDKTISGLVYRGLFKYDIYGIIVPDLADTWAISEDGLVYTIKLKKDQYWSDGRKITADDLIYTSFKVTDLAGVATDKIDDLTVRYTLPNKFSPFLSLLTIGVMPSNSEEFQNPLIPVSSGPFRVIRVEKSGPVVTQVTLIHNDEDINIKKVIFRYYVNEEELVTAARLGEIDGFISSKEQKLQNFSEYKFPTQGVYYALFFNLRSDTLKDVELRKKLEKVIPVDILAYNRGITVQGTISRSIYTDRELAFEKFDGKFNENIQDISVTISVPDISSHIELAKEIKNIWEDKLDIDVDIEKIDPREIEEKVINIRGFEILLYGQETSRDPDRYIYWHSTQKDYPGLNITGFDYIRADRALEEGRNEVDNSKRAVHYNEFQKVINEQVPAIFLYHPFAKFYVSKHFEGIGEKYTFTLSDRFLDFPNWKRIETN